MKVFGKVTIGAKVWAVSSSWDGKFSQMDTEVVSAEVVDVLQVYSEAKKGTCTEVKLNIYVKHLDAVCETEEMAEGYAAVLATSNSYEMETVHVVFKQKLGFKMVSELDSMDAKKLAKYKKLYKDFVDAGKENAQLKALGGSHDLVDESVQYQALGKLLLDRE